MNTYHPHFGALLLCLLPCLLWAPARAGEQEIRITAVPLGERLFYPRHSAPATTLSLNDSRIGAETAGRLLELPVQVGERVAHGDPLARLDCRENQLRRRQAEGRLENTEARLQLARRQIERADSLRRERNVSEELLDQRRAEASMAAAEREIAHAALGTARLDEERCQVSAPFDGIVLERLAGEGEWVAPGQPLLRLLDSARLEVSAQVPLDRIEELRQAREPRFEADGVYPVRISRVVPAVETRGRHREVRLAFSGARALPGSAGRITWRSPTAHLPTDLIQRRGEQLGVFLLEGEQARFHPLPQALEGHPSATGLPAASLLIIEGRHGLRDGQHVRAD
ncbi:MAG: efflux RND transporter periplasmic adaptor subunit [gamma proteobacterium symbiont of Phacoides pectinatus]